MNCEVDLGKVWLPQELVDMVENHKKSMLEFNKDSDSYDMLLNASFSAYFSDFIMKNYFKLKDNQL